MAQAWHATMALIMAGGSTTPEMFERVETAMFSASEFVRVVNEYIKNGDAAGGDSLIQELENMAAGIDSL